MTMNWRLVREPLMVTLCEEGFPTTDIDDLEGEPPYLRVQVPSGKIDAFLAKARRLKDLGLVVRESDEPPQGNMSIYIIRPAGASV